MLTALDLVIQRVADLLLALVGLLTLGLFTAKGLSWLYVRPT